MAANTARPEKLDNEIASMIETVLDFMVVIEKARVSIEAV